MEPLQELALKETNNNTNTTSISTVVIVRFIYLMQNIFYLSVHVGYVLSWEW